MGTQIPRSYYCLLDIATAWVHLPKCKRCFCLTNKQFGTLSGFYGYHAGDLLTGLPGVVRFIELKPGDYFIIRDCKTTVPSIDVSRFFLRMLRKGITCETKKMIG